MAIESRVRELPGLLAGLLPRSSQLAGWTDAELTEFVELLGRASAELRSGAAAAAAEVERRSARELGAESLARRAGVKSGAELVAKITGVTRAEAAKAVRIGGLLEAAAAVMPEFGDEAPNPRSLSVLAALPGPWDSPIAVAVRNRWLSADQGGRLKAGLGEPRDADAAAPWRAACLQLISDCWSGDLGPEELHRAAVAARACLDRQWAHENTERLRELRSLKRSTRSDGMTRYELLVDSLTDQQIWAPIFRQLAPRLGGPRFLSEDERASAAELELDTRSNEQLLADVFTAFLLAGVNASSATATFVPTVTIAVTTSELSRAVTASEPAVAWLEGTATPVSGPQLLAAVCDGRVGAALFDETGRALDVTKHERSYSQRQRAAMALRDGGCLFPGCNMPPAACEGHHINPWGESAANRKTETRDGVLLCRFHHLNLHNQGARIAREGSDYWLHWPGRGPTRLIPKAGVRSELRAQGVAR